MIRLTGYSISEIILGIALTISVYTFSTIIYRLYLHPLSHLPGPKLAASTHLYKTYYSYHSTSPLYVQIDKLHEKYGSVVRIAPNEIHLNDPENYDKIYFVGTKYSKDPELYQAFGINYAGFSTPSNEVHRIRRAALSPMFSRKMVLDLEHVVKSRAQKLADKVQVALESGKEIDLFHGFRAVAIDVVSDFAFDKCYNLLELPDFGLFFFEIIQASNSILWIFQQWPLLRKTILGLPPSFLKRANSGMKTVFEFREHCLAICLDVKNRMESGNLKPDVKPTIFERLLTPGIVTGYTVPTPEDLSDEAYTILGAAADTTGGALMVATYNTIRNPDIYQKLVAELREAFPDPNTELDFPSLEKLPYLTAVIKEGLRVSCGVPGRLPRVVPESGAVLDGYEIPKGAVVSMSAWTLHHNPTYFPNPDTFDPERWLVDAERLKFIEKAFVPFSRGSRMCIGMQLAYSELYIMLGTLFRRFDNMQCNTLSKKDLQLVDYFAAYYDSEAAKLHVSAKRT